MRISPLFFPSVRKAGSSQRCSMTPQILVPPLPRPCTPCPGALHLADNLALVLGQSSAASGSLGPRFLPAPDPEGLTCK